MEINHTITYKEAFRIWIKVALYSFGGPAGQISVSTELQRQDVVGRVDTTKTPILDKFQLPFPTGWDYFFNQRETCFILFHLKNGKKIGGYYGKKSYSCSFPNHGDIYIQTVYKINKDGTFGEHIKDSKGLWISKDNYDYIEIFSIPKTKP